MEMRGREAYERYKEVAFLAKEGGSGKYRLLASYRLVEITFCGPFCEELMDSAVSTVPDGSRMQNTHRNSRKGEYVPRRTFLPSGNQAVLFVDAGEEFAVARFAGQCLVAIAV